jgi:hypothetical protein
VILHYPQEVNTELLPGTFVFMICEDGSEHKAEMLLRRAKLEIRDSIRYFHGSPVKHLTVVVGRKPVEGTVAENTLRYGRGGINIDGCRIPTEEDRRRPSYGGGLVGSGTFKIRERKVEDCPTSSGRWPANVIHDGDGIMDLLPILDRATETSGKGKPYEGLCQSPTFRKGNVKYHDFGDKGSAARFFHTASDLQALEEYLQRLTDPSP